MSSFTSAFFLTAFFSRPEHDRIIVSATGITQKLASTILQSKKIKSDRPTIVVEMSAPMISGIQWLDAVSICAQSPRIFCVRSERFFLPKYDRGRRLSLSAIAVLLTPLSLYVVRKVMLYWIKFVNAIRISTAMLAMI